MENYEKKFNVSLIIFFVAILMTFNSKQITTAKL